MTTLWTQSCTDQFLAAAVVVIAVVITIAVASWIIKRIRK